MTTAQMKLVTVCLCLSGMATAGCALQMNGTTQRLAVASAPPGARVFLDGERVGVTPVEVVVRRRDADVVLKLEKDGFRSAEEILRRSPSRWLGLDVPVSVFFGLAGYWVQGVRTENTAHAVAGAVAGASPAILGIATGAAFAFPDRIYAELVPSSGTKLQDPDFASRFLFPATTAGESCEAEAGEVVP